MTCTHCVNHVVMALKEVGAKDMNVNLDEKFAIAETSTIIFLWLISYTLV